MIAAKTPALVVLAILLASPLAGLGEDQKLVAGDASAYDHFGWSVSISGDTLAAGASHREGATSSEGAVYIFERGKKRWAETAVLTAADPERTHFFGSAISLDGGTLAVGAPNDSDAGVDAGSIYVFEREGGAWAQTAELHASDADPDDALGSSVSVDGDVLVAGAHWDETLGERTGAAYVFERTGGAWTQTAKLLASDGQPYDHFGHSVSVSGDTIVVGTLLGVPTTETGTVYIFEKAGGVWQETAIVSATGSVPGDGFGWSVSLDADLLAVGAPQHAVAGVYESGCAWVFERAGGAWLERDRLAASDAAELDNLGISVAADGDAILVGAPIRIYAPVPPAP